MSFFFSLIKKEIHDQFAAIFNWSAQFFFIREKLVREISGKRQEVLNSDVCGINALSTR